MCARAYVLVCVFTCCLWVYMSAGENVCLVNNIRAFSSLCYSLDLFGPAVWSYSNGGGGVCTEEEEDQEQQQQI